MKVDRATGRLGVQRKVAKEKAYSTLYVRLDTKRENDLFRLARQRDGDRKDVQQVRVIKDRDGDVLTSEKSVEKMSTLRN